MYCQFENVKQTLEIQLSACLLLLSVLAEAGTPILKSESALNSEVM